MIDSYDEGEYHWNKDHLLLAGSREQSNSGMGDREALKVLGRDTHSEHQTRLICGPFVLECSHLVMQTGKAGYCSG
jgi:hypothetical protein